MKNKVLVVNDTEICHVGMNDNNFIFTEEELERAVDSLNKVPLVANVSDFKEDHNTSAYNTVGWVYEPYFKDGSVFANLEITHPEIIEKVSRKTTKGEREINYVSMGCNAEKLICSICGSEVDYETSTCSKGHVVGEYYNNEQCGMIGEGILFDHVALTNIPADKEAKLGKEVITMYANKIRIKASEDKLTNPADDTIKPSEDKVVIALKDKLNVLESEVEKIKEYIQSKEDEITKPEEEEIVATEDELEATEELEATAEEEEEPVKKKEEEKEDINATDKKDDEEEEEKKDKITARKSHKVVEMYKKLYARRFGDLPRFLANTNDVNVLRSAYKIKASKSKTVMKGKTINARSINSKEAQIKAAMEDRTAEGYRKILNIKE